MGLHADTSKSAVAEALLEESSIFVHLDPRHPAVRVPGWLRSGPQLVLQVGYSMAIPIPDLRVDDDGVFATLSFQRSPYTCWIPWDAVFAVVSDDGKGMMWPENLPEEIATDVDREFAKMGAAELEEVLAAADYDADPLHAPSEVRSSITSRPLRLIDSAPPPPPSHAPASQSLSSHSLPTRNGVKPGSQAPSAATPSAATPSAATRRASTPKRSSTSSRPSSAPHLRLIK